MCSLVSRRWNFPSSNICISPISHPTTKTQIFVSHPYPTTKIPKILLQLLSELRWWQKKDFQQKHYFEKTYQRAFEGTIKANFYDLIWAPHASVGHQHWPVFRQTCVTKCLPILSNIQKHTIFISVKISQFHPPTLKWGRKPVWVEIGSPQNWCHKLYHSPVLLPEPIAGQLLTEPCKTQPRDTHCSFEDKDKMPKRPNIQLPEYTILMLLILVTKIWVTSNNQRRRQIFFKLFLLLTFLLLSDFQMFFNFWKYTQFCRASSQTVSGQNFPCFKLPFAPISAYFGFVSLF